MGKMFGGVMVTDEQFAEYKGGNEPVPEAVAFSEPEPDGEPVAPVYTDEAEAEQAAAPLTYDQAIAEAVTPKETPAP